MAPEFSTLPLVEGSGNPVAPARWSLRWVFPPHTEQSVSLTPQLASGGTIGRSADCNIVLASPSVSRTHAQLRQEGEHVIITDLASKNGITVNGSRVSRHRLCPDDMLRLGECIAFVLPEHPESQSEPSLTAQGFHISGLLSMVLKPLRRLAPSDLPIVVEGETGTGKERTARAIHEWSGRRGPFVAVNCAALPENLAEAELFGYRRGAFSGAEQASPGYLRAAHGGTLFLDEVLELPLGVQAKLLRALELREVQPLGESRAVAIDLRVVVAAQGSLSEAVASGKFRTDLLQRLNGFAVCLPPLRERRAELPALFQFQVAQRLPGLTPRFDARVIERLCLHGWPGNVRELEMVVRRLLGLHGHEANLSVEHLSSFLGAAPKWRNEAPPLTLASYDSSELSAALELDALLEALRETTGNVKQAATRCGISRQRAYRLLQANPGLDLASFRRRES